MSYRYSDNECMHSDALFFDAVHLKMNLMQGENGFGPKHVWDYPGVELLENGDVHFCFYAPTAKDVAVSGFDGLAMTSKKHHMQRDADGYWHVTVSGIPEGFHYHEYWVDGTSVLNPQAPIGYGMHRAVNFFNMPEQSDFYSLKSVPHGEIRMEHYFSTVTGRTRNCWVYTPPGYEEGENMYPVLYLQHGGGEDETSWLWQGKMNYILDNLIAENKCSPMLVVMNSLYCVNFLKHEEFLAGDFDTMLMQDCIPFIESKFRVKSGNENRAMAGLSMGSYQTLMTTMRHLGFFPYVGIFSGALDRRWYCDFDYYQNFANPTQFNEKIKLFYFGCGDQEERILTSLSRDFSSFNEKGIQYTFSRYPGYHEWTVWRHCLKEFAQLIFK